MSSDFASLLARAEDCLTQSAARKDLRIAPAKTECPTLKILRTSGDFAAVVSELERAEVNELMIMKQDQAQISPLAPTRVALACMATHPEARTYLLIRDCPDHIELEAIARTNAHTGEQDLELLYLLCADNGVQLGTQLVPWRRPPSALQFEIRAAGENLVDAIWSLFDACDCWAHLSDSDWKLPPQPDLLSKLSDSLDQCNLKIQLLDDYRSDHPQPKGFAANWGWHLRMSENLRDWKAEHARDTAHPVATPFQPDAIKRFLLADYLAQVLSLGDPRDARR